MSDSSLPPSTSGPSGAGMPPRPGDAEHDAWLRSALRHAPDVDASPPEALRRSILDEARAAAFASAQAGHPGAAPAHVASTPRPYGVIGAVAAFWTWLARPPVAAAFASVMAATLVGVMWWDRPLDETLPSAMPPVASIRQSTSTAERSAENRKLGPSTPAEPAARSATSTPSPTSTPSTSSTPTPPSARPAPAKPLAIEDKRAAGAAAAAAERPLAYKERAEPTLQSATQPPANLDAARAPDTGVNVAAAPQPFPTPISPASLAKAAPTPPSASPPPPEVSQAKTRSSTSVGDALGRDAPLPAPAVVFAPPAPDMAPRPESRARAAMGATVSPSTTTRPLADVLGSLAGDPSRWSVQRPNGERVAVDDAVRAWLTRVDDSGRWRSARSIDDEANSVDSAARKAGVVVAEPVTTLTLLRDGRIDTVVRIGAVRVVVERRGDAAGGPSTAILSAQAAAALADTLPTSAR